MSNKNKAYRPEEHPDQSIVKYFMQSIHDGVRSKISAMPAGCKATWIDLDGIIREEIINNEDKYKSISLHPFDFVKIYKNQWNSLLVNPQYEESIPLFVEDNGMFKRTEQRAAFSD